MVEFRVFINFKTYPQGTGREAIELAKILCQAQDKFASVKIIPVVQAVDVFRIRQVVDMPVWVQHVDWQPQGQYTGWVNLEAVLEAGAEGTLLNHSEHPIPPGTVKQIVSRIKGKKDKGQNFEVMVCCKTLGQMKILVKVKPDFLGYEISELIGGELSIVRYSPKAIKRAVEICGEIPLIVGAGIQTKEDLYLAKKWGCGGVLISSAVVLAENPEEKLRELLQLVALPKEG